MLSILIPEYNYDCRSLIKGLVSQCSDAGIAYEILVMDDCSDAFLAENRQMNDLAGVRFIESAEHLHAARIRNKLAKLARYEHLLFLDCDLQIIDNQFINRYLAAFSQAGVLVGSIIYQEEVPDRLYRLRWKYGKVRESRPAYLRNKSPWNAFASANFCIEKELFNLVQFDENFNDYGHEDTLFGLQLKSLGLSILHLDNPLFHKGLDENQRFLEKSLTAVKKYCTQPQFSDPACADEVRIFRVYNQCRKRRLDGILALCFTASQHLLRKQLCSANPNLMLFDLYRLGYLCKLVRKHNTRSGSV